MHKYMNVMATSFTTANSSLDYYGRPLAGDPSSESRVTLSVRTHHGLVEVFSSAYCRSLLTNISHVLCGTGHHGITNAIYGNRTLLSAAAALSAAKQAAAPGELYQLRLSQAIVNVVWVILQRWDELKHFATANAIAWPLSDAKEAAFAVFVEGLTFAFANDEPGFDSGEHRAASNGTGLKPYFTEHVPVSPGSSRYLSKVCDFACFKLQLGL